MIAHNFAKQICPTYFAIYQESMTFSFQSEQSLIS